MNDQQTAMGGGYQRTHFCTQVNGSRFSTILKGGGLTKQTKMALIKGNPVQLHMPSDLHRQSPLFMPILLLPPTTLLDAP